MITFWSAWNLTWRTGRPSENAASVNRWRIVAVPWMSVCTDVMEGAQELVLVVDQA